jgi:hypothetical protein
MDLIKDVILEVIQMVMGRVLSFLETYKVLSWRLTIWCRCAWMVDSSLGSISTWSSSTTYMTFSGCNSLNLSRRELRTGLPLHIQKVLQTAEVLWLACTASPGQAQHDKIRQRKKLFKCSVACCINSSTLTLISNRSTCFGFASALISEVAIVDPGWVTWKPIPGTSYK